jgi:hypothetical protein
MSISSPLLPIKGFLQDAFGRVEMVAHGCGCVRRLACGEGRSKPLEALEHCHPRASFTER